MAAERLKKAIEELCIEVAVNAVHEGLWEENDKCES